MTQQRMEQTYLRRLFAAAIWIPLTAHLLVFAEPPAQRDGSDQRETKRVQSAQGKRQAAGHPELASVHDRLHALLVKSCPSASLKLSDNTGEIVADYHSRDFQVYTIFKNGKIADQPHSERGPEYDGFLLRVTWQPGEYHGAAEIPQDVRKPYWTTYINAVPVPGKQGYLWIQLSYGARTDREILKTLKAAIGAIVGSSD